MTHSILKLGQEFVNIEDVQDRVQEILMRDGFYKVAEAYILYRARRTHDREADTNLVDQQRMKIRNPWWLSSSLMVYLFLGWF